MNSPKSPSPAATRPNETYLLIEPYRDHSTEAFNAMKVHYKIPRAGGDGYVSYDTARLTTIMLGALTGILGSLGVFSLLFDPWGLLFYTPAAAFIGWGAFKSAGMLDNYAST